MFEKLILVCCLLVIFLDKAQGYHVGHIYAGGAVCRSRILSPLQVAVGHQNNYNHNDKWSSMNAYNGVSVAEVGFNKFWAFFCGSNKH
jgi:hypothetical protein